MGVFLLAFSAPGASAEPITSVISSEPHDSDIELKAASGTKYSTGFIRATRKKPGDQPVPAAEEPETEEEKIDRYIEDLGDQDHSLASQAALKLSQMVPQAKRALPALIEALSSLEIPESGPEEEEGGSEVSEERNCQSHYIAAIEALGPAPKNAVPPLSKGLEARDDYTRKLAASALGKMGRAAGPAVPRLIALLKREKRADVADAAVVALGRIGHAANSALPLLRLRMAGPGPAGYRENIYQAITAIEAAAPKKVEAVKR